MKEHYLSCALAANTNKTYTSGFNCYIRFCRELRLSPFPLQQQQLSDFVCSLGSKVSHKTIKVYLSGIQHFSIVRGYPQQIHSMSLLHLYLQGIRREQGDTMGRPSRSPILLKHLRRLFSYFERHYSQHSCLMLKAAVTLAFFGMLR